MKTKGLRANKANFDRNFAVRLMEHLVVPTFVIDANSRVLIWNKACERLTGVLAEDVLQTSDHWNAFYPEHRPCLADLLARGDFDSIGSLYSSWDSYGMSDFGVSVENWCTMPKLGRKLYLSIDAGPIYDEGGNLIAVVETLRDITVQREAHHALQNLAIRDGLTGLHNRRSFDDTFATECQRTLHHRQPLSLLMIDVDFFKLFNDTYGHQMGDKCLRTVAQAISATLHRSGDVAARYGGEEFAVILPNTDTAGAARLAARIRQAVEDLRIPHQASTVAAHVTVSIGAATCVHTEAERLVGAADEALYASKREGRNRVTTVELEQAFGLF